MTDVPADFSLIGGAFPTWTQVAAPTAEHPYWRDVADGERYSVDQILIGRSAQETFLLQRAHGEAIATLVVTAMEARARGDWGTARRLTHAASRLAGEVVGQAPVALTRAR